jgi:hypothetical protein
MDECCICLSPLYYGYKLECNHMFHEICLEKCQQDLCPLCRQPFKLISNVYILYLESIIPFKTGFLFEQFPTLLKDCFAFKTINFMRMKICFQDITTRDKWFDKLNHNCEEIISCQKETLAINIR